MPFVENTDYSPTGFFKNAHFNTIYPHLLRKQLQVTYWRKRFETRDGDFVDVDFLTTGSNTLVLLMHGLEGSSSSHYIKGMTKHLSQHGLDIAVMMQRGCSGVPNKAFKSYHSGKTDDLHDVVTKICTDYAYTNIFLVGFSMGGNICLKYAGEMGIDLHSNIRGMAAISVPCDLADSALHLTKKSNRVYMRRFMNMLKLKLFQKIELYPDAGLSEELIHKCKDFKQFDDLYTAPVNGYQSAEHYWTENSSKSFIPDIKRKTLIINSLDDPFFGMACHPIAETKQNHYTTLELLNHGGHVGFAGWNIGRAFWHEERVGRFILEHMG